jgi:hypothetical protein
MTILIANLDGFQTDRRPPGNWTAASGIASDELRNVPAKVVIDSLP